MSANDLSAGAAAAGEGEGLEDQRPSPRLEEREEGSEEEEGQGEGVGQLLRATVEELESALKDTRQLLAARDQELEASKQELEHYKQQAAREIANKTRLAQALDQSQNHVAQLEELLQTWQLQLQELKGQSDKFQSALRAEQLRSQELEGSLSLQQEQEKEIEMLKMELEKYKLQSKGRLSWQQHTPPTSPVSMSGPMAIDAAQQLFLKQAVYHLLTDFHAEEQLRAIVSILDFDAKERKAVYSKMQEKGGLYR